MKNVGFKTSWMKEETEKLEAPQVFGQITPAQAELYDRISYVETIIIGEGFSKMPPERKAEVIAEHKWLVSINAQLGGY